MLDSKPKTYKNQQKQLIVFRGLCKGCGLCLEKCLVKAISFSKSDLGYYSTPTVEIDIEKCISCGICELVCPDCALRLDKSKK